MSVWKFRGTPFPPCPEGWQDHTYKQSHGIDIPLRIWPAAQNADATSPAPWLIWIHGGGWIAGKYSAPNAWVVPAFTSRGYHVVSIAYRFCPQVTLAGMDQDCLDAYTWCHEHLERILGNGTVDLSRFVIAGDSAGGYLATRLALNTPVPAKAVVAVYALVDWVSAYARDKAKQASAETSQAPKYYRSRTEQELQASLYDHDPSHAEVFTPWDGDLPDKIGGVGPMQRFLGMPRYVPDEKVFLRLDTNAYLSASKVSRLGWVFRYDPKTTSEEDFIAVLRDNSPHYLIDERKEYPPTFFLHGDRDDAVLKSQALDFAAKLQKMGVPTGSAFDPEGGHAFEIFISVRHPLQAKTAKLMLQGPDDDGWQEFIVPTMDFVDKHCK